MKRVMMALSATLALVALPAFAGEWHTGNANLCTDCHTMHFSQQHRWDGEGAISTTPAADGNWLSTTGPNEFLLKAPVNTLCASCHNGQTFAPDVIGVNTNAGTVVQGRSAGGLTELGAGGHETFMGHELDSTDVPPGYDTAYLTAVGAGDWYDETGGLECTSCHTQHGIAGVYRNLGPRGLGTANLPSYTISTTNNTARDVWIRIDPATYTPNSGAATTFSPFYDQANVFYNRVDKTVGGRMTSNGIDTQCSGCHGTFHGGTADTNIDPVPGDNHSFVRHPTSQETLNTGGSGTSNINRFRPIPEAVKVKVYTNDYTTYADASPGCVTCHKAHGNKNPFGLIFLSRTATTNNEEGGNGTELPSPGTATYQRGYRNLCGQCHGQGN